MTRRPTLTTHQLRERGWTPAMIRDLLGRHDATRPSEMRVGSRNRLVEAEVKLYHEDRVIAAEATEKFARHQEAARARQDAAERARATRQEHQRRRLREYVLLPLEVEPHPDAASMDQKTLWAYHNNLLYALEAEHDDLLLRVPSAQRRQARNDLYTRYRQAVYELYGWPQAEWAVREMEAVQERYA